MVTVQRADGVNDSFHRFNLGCDISGIINALSGTFSILEQNLHRPI